MTRAESERVPETAGELGVPGLARGETTKGDLATTMGAEIVANSFWHSIFG